MTVLRIAPLFPGLYCNKLGTETKCIFFSIYDVFTFLCLIWGGGDEVEFVHY
jgi:hypothetical protein